MSLVERLEVPLPKSLRSKSATSYPREAASTAMPTPVAPPPTTARSHGVLRPRRRSRRASRFMRLKGGGPVHGGAFLPIPRPPQSFAPARPAVRGVAGVLLRFEGAIDLPGSLHF